VPRATTPKRLACLVALLLHAPVALAAAQSPGAAAAAPAREATPPDPAAILSTAFRKRYDVDLTSEVELVMRNRRDAEHRRIFEAAAKLIDGRLHSIGRLTEPQHLRDMTILTIEAEDRRHDAFVYLPALGRVRRISTAQRGDAFFGTDVTYEDLERRHADEFAYGGVEGVRVQGEAAWLVRARPVERSRYERVEYLVAKADAAILEARYYKRRASEPYRIVRSLREGMVAHEDHLVPTRLVVENRARGTTTTAHFRELALDPEIDDRLFSASALEVRRRAR